MAGPTGAFRFRKLDSIGAADAEEDRLFLKECFVDTGDLEALRDCSDPRRLILGRTGSGKSALIFKLREVEDRSLEVEPESLALAYISNSTILRFFSELGVKLDIFFKLLWRHVFTVEILKHHFHIFNEADKRSFVEKICAMFRDRKHARAVDYLKKWGESFWEETEYRIKELTTTLEENLKAAAELKGKKVSFSVEGARTLTDEQKAEIVQRAQHVVNEVQIKQLSEVLDLVNDVLQDQQKRYFILIDRLDEDWVEEKLRMRLIRALIETVKDFGRVRNAKIVVAIRWDLIDRVFRLTRDGGFQEEKYESLYLPLHWTKAQLGDVLNKRVNRLIQQRFTKAPITYADILPKKVDDQHAFDYMIQRTFMRPRDLISFFNYCIQKAIDRPQITAQMVREAEGEYSRDRFRSLGDEWASDYPNLLDFARILRALPREFAFQTLTEPDIGEFSLTFVVNNPAVTDVLAASAQQIVNCEISPEDFKRNVFQVFYRVGIVGIKLQQSESFTWASSGRRAISQAEILDTSRIAVHPVFWRVLGTKIA